MDSDLTNEMKRLSIADRIVLAGDIGDSISDENEAVELTGSQKVELDRRSKAFTTGRTWEEIVGDITGGRVQKFVPEGKRCAGSCTGNRNRRI